MTHVKLVFCVLPPLFFLLRLPIRSQGTLDPGTKGGGALQAGVFSLTLLVLTQACYSDETGRLPQQPLQLFFCCVTARWTQSWQVHKNMARLKLPVSRQSTRKRPPGNQRLCRGMTYRGGSQRKGSFNLCMKSQACPQAAHVWHWAESTQQRL